MSHLAWLALLTLPVPCPAGKTGGREGGDLGLYPYTVSIMMQLLTASMGSWLLYILLFYVLFLFGSADVDDQPLWKHIPHRCPHNHSAKLPSISSPLPLLGLHLFLSCLHSLPNDSPFLICCLSSLPFPEVFCSTTVCRSLILALC